MVDESCYGGHDLDDIMREDVMETLFSSITKNYESFDEWYLDVLKEDTPLVLLFNEENRFQEEKRYGTAIGASEDSYEIMMSYLLRKERVDCGFDQIGEIPWRVVETPFMISLIIRSIRSFMIVIEGLECGIDFKTFDHPIVYCQDPHLIIIVSRLSIREVKFCIETRCDHGRLVTSYTIQNVCKRLGITVRLQEDRIPVLKTRKSCRHDDSPPNNNNINNNNNNNRIQAKRREGHGIATVIKNLGFDLDSLLS